MAWDRDSLWAKATVFFERAFNESKSDPLFGLWAAMGLELLGRSAISNFSPTLLAEPDRNHKNLLHALGRGSEKNSKKSLASSQIFQLCTTLYGEFNDELCSICTSMINRRNEELHSGTSAFSEYPSSLWYSGFCRSCKVLCECQGKNLAELFGNDEAENAYELMRQARSEVESVVKRLVSNHKNEFEVKSLDEQIAARKAAEKTARQLSWNGYHKEPCPACNSDASVAGVLYGEQRVSHEEGEVVVRQPVSPRDFQCSACGLKLKGYAQLEIVGLGGRHTRTSYYTPAEYFGLEDPREEREYDNE